MRDRPYALGTKVAGYARLLRKRTMGRVSFWDVRIMERTLQLQLSASITAEYGTATKIPVGSSIWIDGAAALSNTGDFLIACSIVTLIAPCTRPFFDKQSGVRQETRYKDRLAGLLANPESFTLFARIARATQEIRSFLWNSGFQEFSTGVLQEHREAGTANVFFTRCEANGRTYYLTLTSELKLKKLQVAGFNNVFEILQSFRNEGMDTMHSPEFTLLEVYKTGADCGTMMKLLEQMLEEVAWRVYGMPFISSADGNIKFGVPLRRVPFYQACEDHLGLSREACRLDVLAAQYPELFAEGMGMFTWVFKVINKLLSPHYEQPTFITELPNGISPFVKTCAHDATVTERAALVVRGVDLADIYSDEHDPARVRAAMRRQSAEAGVPVNEGYLRILEYGVPPSASIGMGLNRLFMLMRGALPENIKETILFPLQ